MLSRAPDPRRPRLRRWPTADGRPDVTHREVPVLPLTHRPLPRRRLVIASAALAAVALVGCGGGNDRSLRPLQLTGDSSTTSAPSSSAPTTTSTTTDPEPVRTSTTAPSGSTTSPDPGASTTTSTTAPPPDVEAALSAAAAEAVEGIGELSETSCTQIATGDHRCDLTLTNGEVIRIDVLVNPDGTYTWEYGS